MKIETMAGLFKKNDIRGKVATDLTPEFGEKLGYLFGQFVGPKNIAIGGDTRESTPKLIETITKGLQKSKCNVYNLGKGPTPMTYFVAAHFDHIGEAIMVTGSHNPPDQNGIKISNETGQSYHYDNLFKHLEDQMKSFETDLDDLVLIGEERDGSDLKEAYFDYLKKDVTLKNKFSIIVDYGKGATTKFGEVLESLGLDYRELGANPDGTFEGHPPDPAKPRTFNQLKEYIQPSDKIAIAFDTDGDRVGFMTNSSEIISPDQVTMLLAETVKKQNSDPIVIIDVKVSKATAEYIENMGGKTLLSQVGHSYIHELLIKEKADLAAELSGHYYFHDRYYGFDDGLYTAIRFLEAIDLLISNNQSLESKLEKLPKFDATPEFREEMSYSSIDKILNELVSLVENENGTLIDIDGVRGELLDGWFLARKSGTEELISYRVEGNSPEAKERILELLQSVIAKY